MKTEKYAIPWKGLAQRWRQYYRAPGRPSKGAIANYRKYLRQSIKGTKRMPRVLILGSTPELRDLVYQEKCQVVFVDLNLEMILAMSQLVKLHNPNEIMVRADWRKLPFPDNYFDAVLGDIVLANVPYKDQGIFLKGICRVLKPKGYFITKMSVIPDDWNFEGVKSILNKYYKVKYNRSVSMQLLCHLYVETYNQDEQTVDLNILRKLLSPYWRFDKFVYPNKKVEKMLNDLWEMWKPLDKVWSFGFEKDVNKFLSNFFRLKDRVVLSDCAYKEIDESFPILFLQVKK